jgi:predicted GIY-YIG superfamily endonuclease
LGSLHLPYIQGIIDKIVSVLRKKEIKISFKPSETIKQKMKLVKDEPDHKKCKGVYKIECSRGKYYIGETGRSFQNRIKEHGADIKIVRTCTSLLAEHSSSSKHHICLEDTIILVKEYHFFKRRIKKAIEILKHPNNLNRDNSLEISEN